MKDCEGFVAVFGICDCIWQDSETWSIMSVVCILAYKLKASQAFIIIVVGCDLIVVNYDHALQCLCP